MKWVIVIFCFLWGFTSQAATGMSLEYTGMRNVDGNCAHGLVWLNWQATGETEDAPGLDWIAITLSDAQGTPLDVWATAIPVGVSQSEFNLELVFGIDYGAMNDLIARPVIARIVDTGDLTGIVDKRALYTAATGATRGEVIIDPGSLIPGCAALPLEVVQSGGAETEPLNGVIGMLDVAVFYGTIPMEMSLDVYEITGVTGDYAFTITQDMLDTGNESEVDTRLHVSASGLIELWALADGRYLLRVMDGIGGVTDLFFYNLGGAMEGYSYSIYAPIMEYD